MRFSIIALTSFLAISVLNADQVPTETREEKLLSIEIGTLTEINAKDPDDVLVTFKTNKQSYYLFSAYSIMIKDGLADVRKNVSDAASVGGHSNNGCMVLHLLFPLRPDGTPDNPQGNARFYPDRNHRGSFGSSEYNDEQFPSLSGMYLTKIPVPKMPDAVGGTALTYQSVSQVVFNLPCIIETQQEKPIVESNTFLDGHVTYDPPEGLKSSGGVRGNTDDNPFGLGTSTVKVYSNNQGWNTLSRVMFYVTPIGISIGNGKVPIYTTVSLKDLQPLIENEFKGQLVEGSMKVTQTTLSGLGAYNVSGFLKPSGPVNFSETWVLISPHTVLRVSVQSMDRVLFDRAVDSLKTLKITPK